MSVITSFKSEILKTKRTASFYLTIVAAAVIPLIFLLDILFDGISEENRKDAFNAMFKTGFSMVAFAILPMFIVLICTLLPQIEYRNNAWKQVFASPQSKLEVFVSKFMNVHYLILLFLVAYHVFMFASALLINFIDPSLHLLQLPLDVYLLWANVVNAYVTILALTSIQFCIGLMFKNFIIPIAIGFACWFLGALLVLEMHSSYGSYFPYSFPVFSVFKEYKGQLATVQWTSALYCGIFLLLGFLLFKRKGS